MADISEKIGPVVESLLEPGETLEGMCVGSRQGLMSGKFVIVAATDRQDLAQDHREGDLGREAEAGGRQGRRPARRADGRPDPGNGSRR
ncbi:MAG: hypothetical protein ABWZ43_04605 [Solirubrobacterales bacterium]